MSNLSQKKGVTMGFFAKLFGLVSKSAEKSKYARATSEYAKSLVIHRKDALTYNNRGLVYRAWGSEFIQNFSRLFKRL